MESFQWPNNGTDDPESPLSLRSHTLALRSPSEIASFRIRILIKYFALDLGF